MPVWFGESRTKRALSPGQVPSRAGPDKSRSSSPIDVSDCPHPLNPAVDQLTHHFPNAVLKLNEPSPSLRQTLPHLRPHSILPKSPQLLRWPPAPPRASAYRDHPPYKDMILRAVADLMERKGSSRRSISKYIAAIFSDLPKTHDALLSTHIRRLRKRGLLVMVRHSYTFPRSDVDAGAQGVTPKPPRSGGQRKYGELLSSNEGFSAKSERNLETPRRPGRPRKIDVAGPPPRVSAPSGPKRRPGRPPRVSASGVAPVEKRRPGRPRKSVAPDVPMVGKRRLGRPPGALGALSDPKRMPGRPPKLPVRGALLRGMSLLGNRRPGRPPKIPETGESPVLKRRPGRPPELTAPGPKSPEKSRPRRAPRNLVADAPPARKSRLGRPLKAPVLGEPPAVKRRLPSSAGLVRKPGRPRKNLDMAGFRGTTALLEPSAAAIGVTEKRKPGRPRNAPQSAAVSVYRNNASRVVLIMPKRLKPSSDRLLHATANTPMNKRRPGRPKKDSAVPSAAAAAVNMLSGKRKRGLPGKLIGNVEPGRTSMPTSVSGSIRRKPGRPRKVSSPLPSAKAINGTATSPDRLHQLAGIAIGETETDLSPVPAAAKALVEMRKGGRSEAANESVEKRKVGRPKKGQTNTSSILEVNDNASLDLAQPPSAKETAEVRFGPDQMPTAGNESADIHIPGEPGKMSSFICDTVLDRGNVTSVNQMQSSPEKVTRGLEPCTNTMPADATATIKKRKPGRPRKVLAPSSALAEENGGVPSAKRRGRPPKRSSFF